MAYFKILHVKKKKLTGACLCCKNTTEQEGPKAQRCQIKGENSVVF